MCISAVGSVKAKACCHMQIINVQLNFALPKISFCVAANDIKFIRARQGSA